MKQHKLGSKGNPFLVAAGEAEYKIRQEKNRRMSQMLEMLDQRHKQEIIDVITNWLIAARDSPKDSDASLRLDAKTAYYDILRQLKPSDGLSEIRATLGLPDDTPEPLVGAIWHLQQRIEDLEEEAKCQDFIGNPLEFSKELVPLMVELSKKSCDHMVKGIWLRDWIDSFKLVWHRL